MQHLRFVSEFLIVVNEATEVTRLSATVTLTEHDCFTSNKHESNPSDNY